MPPSYFLTIKPNHNQYSSVAYRIVINAENKKMETYVSISDII
jgi:hypothetical protein